MEKKKKKSILSEFKKKSILSLLLVPLIVWYLVFLRNPMHGIQVVLRKLLFFIEISEN